MPKFRFENVWNIGNVFTAILLMAGLIGVYIDLRVILTNHNDRLEVLEKQAAGFLALSAAVVTAQSSIVRIQDDVKDSKQSSKEAVEQLTLIRIDMAKVKALYEKELDLMSRGRDH